MKKYCICNIFNKSVLKSMMLRGKTLIKYCQIDLVTKQMNETLNQ